MCFDHGCSEKHGHERRLPASLYKCYISSELVCWIHMPKDRCFKMSSKSLRWDRSMHTVCCRGSDCHGLRHRGVYTYKCAKMLLWAKMHHSCATEHTHTGPGINGRDTVWRMWEWQSLRRCCNSNKQPLISCGIRPHPLACAATNATSVTIKYSIFMLTANVCRWHIRRTRFLNSRFGQLLEGFCRCNRCELWQRFPLICSAHIRPA